LIKKIFASLLDEMILFGVAVILWLLTGLILGAVGFRILQPGVFLTAYLFVANVFYFPIMEKSTTLGKRIIKLDETVKVEAIKVEEIEEIIEVMETILDTNEDEITEETNEVK